MRVGYARVSTTDQPPELQLDALRRAGCERIHSEKASGAKADHAELTRVLDDVLRRGDVLVVWKLDRLARSLKKLITTAEDLEGRGIGLVSLTESIDTTTPGGVLVFHVFGAIAQFERALIRDRTYENQQHPASGLNLVVTAIILWNTRYLERAVATLRQTEDVPDHLFAHLSPLGWEHVNLTGDYIWAAAREMSENIAGLRPLRAAPDTYLRAA